MEVITLHRLRVAVNEKFDLQYEALIITTQSLKTEKVIWRKCVKIKRLVHSKKDIMSSFTQVLKIIRKKIKYIQHYDSL